MHITIAPPHVTAFALAILLATGRVLLTVFASAALTQGDLTLALALYWCVTASDVQAIRCGAPRLAHLALSLALACLDGALAPAATPRARLIALILALVLIAGLAARVDGPSRWRVLWAVTLVAESAAATLIASVLTSSSPWLALPLLTVPIGRDCTARGLWARPRGPLRGGSR